MTWEEFNATVVTNETDSAAEYDLRPLGARQVEALELWLENAAKSGDIFGKINVVKTDASVVLSTKARLYLAELQLKQIPIKLVAER